MKMKTLGLAAATLLAPMAAQASTIIGTFDATPAVSDRSGHVGSFWFQTALSATLSNTFTLVSPGSFIADAAGAMFMGSVANNADASAGLDLNFVYDRDFSDNADSTPEFKAVFNDVFAHNNEDYFDFEGGTVTGTGSLLGLVIELTRAPASGEFVTQVGGGIESWIGPNQVNSNFGLSGWMEISGISVDYSTCTACDEPLSFYESLVNSPLGQTDLNVDLAPASVPLPASDLMLIVALGGAGALRRRRG